MNTLKDMVKGDKKARFAYYRDQALHYETEDGFVFPVPISETGSATYNAEERAMLLMRYIRKHLEVLSRSKGEGT